MPLTDLARGSVAFAIASARSFSSRRLARVDLSRRSSVVGRRSSVRSVQTDGACFPPTQLFTRMYFTQSTGAHQKFSESPTLNDGSRTVKMVTRKPKAELSVFSSTPHTFERRHRTGRRIRTRIRRGHGSSFTRQAFQGALLRRRRWRDDDDARATGGDARGSACLGCSRAHFCFCLKMHNGHARP